MTGGAGGVSDGRTRQIGLFGGSFNPPHVCHALASLWALQTYPLDEVWWMPTYQHAFGKALVPFEQRVALCERAASDLRGVQVIEIERELGGESRTIDTVRVLRERHVDCAFWLIVGSDIIGERHKWKDWDGLMALVKLIVVGRNGYDAEGLPRADAREDFALPRVSSTALRRALAAPPEDDEAQAMIRAWMHHDVVSMIRAEGLYTETGSGQG